MEALLVEDGDASEFGALAAATRAELAPEGTLSADLVSRVVMETWRARRADRLEAALPGHHVLPPTTTPALAPADPGWQWPT